MTAPSLLDELEGVVRLMEAATPGEWFSQVSDPAEGVDCFWLMSLQASKALTEEVGSVNGSQWDDTQRANAELIARAVNFIRTHHAEIAAMAKRLEAAERKVSRLTAMRNEWERDAREHLNTFGQHLPASVECLVERFDAATQEGEG